MDGKASDAASVAAGTDQSRAVVSDPAPAAVPAWVGTAVWRGIWQLIAAVLLTAAALWFAGRASDLIGYLILAQLLAFALEPAVSWLHTNRGWRRGSATGVLLVAILGLFVLLGVGMGSVLASQVDQAAAQVPGWIDKLNAFTQEQFDTTVVSTSSAASSGQATQHVTQLSAGARRRPAGHARQPGRRRLQPVHRRAVHLLLHRQRPPDPPRPAVTHAP
jgi:hypothetical protein